MKQRAFLLVLLALLLLASIVMAQSSGAGWYTVGPGTAAGGRYRLDSLAWQVEGTAGGGWYILSSPVRATLRGSGCCCAYLPCLFRKSH